MVVLWTKCQSLLAIHCAQFKSCFLTISLFHSLLTFVFRSPATMMTSCGWIFKILCVVKLTFLLQYVDMGAYAIMIAIWDGLPFNFTRRILSDSCLYAKIHFFLSYINQTHFSLILSKWVNDHPLQNLYLPSILVLRIPQILLFDCFSFSYIFYIEIRTSFVINIYTTNLLIAIRWNMQIS